jgi:flagellar biosynthesis/type III secretory pathway ATPase
VAKFIGQVNKIVNAANGFTVAPFWGRKWPYSNTENTRKLCTDCFGIEQIHHQLSAGDHEMISVQKTVVDSLMNIVLEIESNTDCWLIDTDSRMYYLLKENHWSTHLDEQIRQSRQRCDNLLEFSIKCIDSLEVFTRGQSSGLSRYP